MSAEGHACLLRSVCTIRPPIGDDSTLISLWLVVQCQHVQSRSSRAEESDLGVRFALAQSCCVLSRASTTPDESKRVTLSTACPCHQPRLMTSPFRSVASLSRASSALSSRSAALFATRSCTRYDLLFPLIWLGSSATALSVWATLSEGA